MGNDVSNRAMMLQGHRLKGPPTLSSMDYPEKQNLENDTPRGSDASQNRSTFDLARRNKGPATAVSHSSRVMLEGVIAVTHSTKQGVEYPESRSGGHSDNLGF